MSKTNTVMSTKHIPMSSTNPPTNPPTNPQLDMMLVLLIFMMENLVSLLWISRSRDMTASSGLLSFQNANVQVEMLFPSVKLGFRTWESSSHGDPRGSIATSHLQGPQFDPHLRFSAYVEFCSTLSSDSLDCFRFLTARQQVDCLCYIAPRCECVCVRVCMGPRGQLSSHAGCITYLIPRIWRRVSETEPNSVQ